MNKFLKVETDLGILYVIGTKSAVTAITWKKPLGVDELGGVFSGYKSLKDCRSQLIEYFKGDRREFELSFEFEGTEFQKCVWNELVKIPYGQTISYAELAKRVENPRAMQAVGSANGANPLSIIVPCHRVIASDGKLSGYAGGVDKKESLLRLEGAII